MKKSGVKLLSLIISGLISNAVIAEEAALEEILITAQKRVQKLQDVPISVNTLSGEKIEDAGITSIERIADYIPSFNMTQTGIGTNIAIRGISSGVNQGFEQSAAQFVDGIHYGRSQLARSPFLDIERIEVLRGPQSIIFGKNSTAGAISITTAKPTQDFEGKISALYEPEYGEQDFRLVLSGPLSETFSGRLAILSSSVDGYMDNITLNRDESGDDNQVVRGSLRWQPTDNWDINLKIEDGSFDSDGRNIEVVKPVTYADPRATGITQYRDALNTFTQGQYWMNTARDWKRESNGDYSYNDMENQTLSVEYEMENHTITSVTGHNAYNYQELCDCDFTGAPGFTILSDEDYTQFSQELRIASSEDQTFSYLAGVFFQSSSLDFHDTIGVPTNSFIATAFVSRLGATAANALRGASTQRDFEQDTDLSAIFAQGTWNFTDTSRLILGARFTQETKDAMRHQYHVTPSGTELPVGTPADAYNALWGIFNVEPYAPMKGNRDESAFTPLVTYQFDLNSTDMVYASFTTGFKSGGYDVRANSHSLNTVNNAYRPETLAPNTSENPTNQPVVVYRPIIGTFEFEEEKVNNFELGGKFLFGGEAELNVALFRSEFTDMQTSQFDGSLSFNVTNAGEALVQGLEVDGRWAVTDPVLLRGGIAFIDFEYTDFKNAQCYFGQVDNIAPAGDGVCDATGKRREFTPEIQGNLGVDYTVEFSSMKLVSTLDLIYSSDYLTTPSLDPKFKQDAYTKINARIALSGNDDMWEVALIGKNLTDEAIVSYANGLPVSSTLTSGTGSAYYAFYEKPVTVALQGTLKF